MASRNVSGDVDIDSDQEVSGLSQERTSRGHKRVVHYGDRMPYRQGTTVVSKMYSQ